MGRIINVNYEEVYNFSKIFENQSKVIMDINNNLLEVIDMIDTCWQGTDANNYKNNFKKYSRKFIKESNNLKKWSEFLLKTSIKYNENIQEGLQKASGMNELDDKDNV